MRFSLISAVLAPSSAFRTGIRGAHFLANVPLKSRNGAVDIKTLENKPLVLYFSAGWCRSCKMFTPKIGKFYKGNKDEGFNVVWVSRDRAAEDQVEYYEKAMPDWAYIPFGTPEIQEFIKKYEVKTIPAVKVVNDAGDVIDDGARMKIEKHELEPKDVIAEWKKLI
uniref:protein-disulfide reductase n=1 Tax=Panagrellus redivivus TaxID=6233 RepID=A0A7E4V8R2_PANRE